VLLNGCHTSSKGEMVHFVIEREMLGAVRATRIDGGMEIQPGNLKRGVCPGLHDENRHKQDRLSLGYRILQLDDTLTDVSSGVGRGATMSVRLSAR
jgi:hypothetical protein